jgi:hypothetical protein
MGQRFYQAGPGWIGNLRDRMSRRASSRAVPNLEAYTWNAIFLPKGAPAEMVNKLNRATVEAMESPNVREWLEGLGAVIVPPVRATPEYLAHFVRSEIEKWTGPIKASGVTVESRPFRGTCARNHRVLGQSHGTQRQAETPLQLLYAPFVKTIAFRALTGLRSAARQRWLEDPKRRTR